MLRQALEELLESLERINAWERGLGWASTWGSSITGVLSEDWQVGLEGVHDEVCLSLNMRVLADLSHVRTIIGSQGWSLKLQMLLVL